MHEVAMQNYCKFVYLKLAHAANVLYENSSSEDLRARYAARNLSVANMSLRFHDNWNALWMYSIEESVLHLKKLQEQNVEKLDKLIELAGGIAEIVTILRHFELMLRAHREYCYARDYHDNCQTDCQTDYETAYQYT